jgi:hypothetical protein
MDYKKYSLENLENWMHDALSCSEATPQEIYDVIKDVVSENYYIYKDHTARCNELLALLNGNGKGHLSCDKDDKSPECQHAWTDFWEENYYPEEYTQYSEEELNAMCDAAEKKDNVVKWQLPVQVDGLTGDCFVEFPDDLLEAANLKEGDTVEWIDRKDGSFELRKVNGTK